MSSITRNRFPVKPTRRTAGPDHPFAEGLFVEPRKVFIPGEGWMWTGNPSQIARHVAPEPLRLSDAEQLILDELRGDWPPADADLDSEGDPADWQDWTDAFRFVPSAEDEAWAASELNRDAADFDLVAPARDVVRASMIDPDFARGLATGAIDLF